MIKSKDGLKRGVVTLVARKETRMLWTIAVILFVLWLLGLITAHTFGGYIYILLVIAAIIVVYNFIRGRK